MMTPTNFYAFFDQPTQQNIESNQRGRLTPEQQSALKQGVRQQWWRVVIWAFVLFILCAVFGLFFWALASEDLGPALLGPVLTTAGVFAIGLIVLAAFLFPDLSLVFVGGDIEAGQVEAVLGKVEWTGRRYQVVAESRRIRTVRGNVSLPPPGEYRFYCLPNSGQIIMAEAVENVSAGQSQNLLLEALSRAHHFSLDDLGVNRQSALGGAQALRLIGYAVVQGVVLILSAGGGAWMYFNLPIGREDQLWAIVIGIFLAILALSSIWNIIKTSLDLLTQSVAHEDGFVTRQEHRTRNGRYYTYQIKKLKFRVSRSAFHALVDSWEYRVYYSSRSKRLLAIEPLRSRQMMIPEDITR
jgi:hypothetical protein